MIIQQGHRIGVLTGNSRLHFAMHAAADTQGFVLVPLPMRDTPEAIAAYLDESAVDVLITDGTHAALAQQVRGGRPTLLCDDDAQPTSHLDGPLGAPSEAADTLAILRTGGTTSQRSLIRIPRSALAAHRRAACQRLQCDGDSVWLASLPMWHMGGLGLVDRCLHGGGRLVLQDGFDADATARALATHPVTHVSLVPTMLGRLIESDAPVPKDLRCALLGGDALPEPLAQAALAAGWPVYASYGMTETCGQIATATPDERRAHPGTSGRPLDGVTVWIVDDEGAEAAPGVSGEIMVDGPTLAVPGPLATGDLGHMDDLGHLFVTGRADDRITTGGEKVDPSRVEAVVAADPEVAECIVAGVPDPEWGQRIVAGVVWHGTGDAEALRQRLKTRLAAHEVPKEIRVLDAVPRTEAGKPRRAAFRLSW